METETRKTGIDVIGDIAAWGTHFCLFYETKEDLFDTMVSYCKSGLENEEYCLWVVAESFTIEEARDALKDAVPELDRHLEDSNLELASARDWFQKDGMFEGERARRNWYDRLARAGTRRYRGVRATGDTSWLGRKDWKHWCDFEDGMNEVFRALVSSWPVGNRRLAMLCTYPLEGCGAPQILDVVRTHQFVLARRYGNWDIVETAGLKQAKAEIARLNEELEQRVVERTAQLMQASEALREAQAELLHINRVTAMGQLAASITHEVNQPLTAMITNADVGSRWLDRQPPDVEEARQALDCIIQDGKRASDVIGQLRALIRKEQRPRKDDFEIDKVILEVIALTRGELVKNAVSVQTQLAEGLPLIRGDRVQLQQVILNLILNAVQAMSGITERTRELLIRTEQEASGAVLVTVQDSGPGFSRESVDRLFDPFYTTKADGMGMGLSICRSIVDAHGGRIWALLTAGLGAVVQFSL
ncbi:MAG TPA: MEDS domain-containing protein [Candidatus Binatia bacterium]|jgi:signal transduction histidine kinase